MNIRKLKAGDKQPLENFLVNYTETSMFLRSNLRNSGIEFSDEPYKGDYFGSFDNNGKINGVLAHYWNDNVMMQAPDPKILDALIAAFHNAVKRPIAGILGAKEQAEQVLSTLKLDNADFATNVDEGLYALDLEALQLPDNIPQHYKMTAAAKTDHKILHSWLKEFELEALGVDDDDILAKHIAERVKRITTGNDCWVLEVENQPVCLSGFNARLPDIVQIGPVWTPPEQRNKGYARTLLALTLEHARTKNVKKSILFTDNPYAAKAYEATGFRQCGHYRLALLKKPVTLK